MKDLIILMNKKPGFSFTEVLIGMMIFTIGLFLIFVIPSSIVRESKEISNKMSLYQVAINEAEDLISVPRDSNKLTLNNTYTNQYFFNGATYTGIYEINSINVQAINMFQVIENGSLIIDESTPTTMSINYASITFLDPSGDYAVSFRIIQKN